MRELLGILGDVVRLVTMQPVKPTQNEACGPQRVHIANAETRRGR